MHEMSLCENIRTTLEEEGRKQAFRKVTRVCLEIGPLAGVEVEAMRFGFDVVMQGSLAEGAHLDIVTSEAAAWCIPCGKTIPIRARFDACPECGSHQLQITSGEELKIKELEVD